MQPLSDIRQEYACIFSYPRVVVVTQTQLNIRNNRLAFGFLVQMSLLDLQSDATHLTESEIEHCA